MTSCAPDVIFTIPGDPVGWQRAGRNGKQSYTPAKTAAFKRNISWQGKLAMIGRPAPDKRPVRVWLTFSFAVPKSWSAKRRHWALIGRTPPIGKPDLDNVSKAVLDALNGICWRDDSQVVELTAVKQYGSLPRTAVAVFYLPTDGTL